QRGTRPFSLAGWSRGSIHCSCAARHAGLMAVRLALIQLPQLLADVIGSVFTPDDGVVVEQLADELGNLRDSDRRRRRDGVLAGGHDPWDDELRAQIARIDAVVLGLRPDGRLTWI